jgi:hypothetical protein
MSRAAWNSSTFTDPLNKHQQPRQASPLHTTRSKKKTALVQKTSRFARIKQRGQHQLLQKKQHEKIANSSQLKAKQLQQQKDRERRSLLAREKDLKEEARQRIRAKDDERRKAQAELSKQGDGVGNPKNHTDAVDTGLGTMRNNTGRAYQTNGTLPPTPPSSSSPKSLPHSPSLAGALEDRNGNDVNGNARNTASVADSNPSTASTYHTNNSEQLCHAANTPPHSYPLAHNDPAQTNHQTTTATNIVPPENEKDNSIEHLLAATAPMVGISDTWKEDLEQHQMNYMTSLRDPGVFTAELLRQQKQDKLNKEKKKKRNKQSSIAVKIELGDLIAYDHQKMNQCVLNQLCLNLQANNGAATICELSLSNANINDSMLHAIADALATNQHVTALNVVKNDITSQGIVSLAKALSTSTKTNLRLLKLSHNNIGDRGVAALAAVLHDTVLQAIELTNVNGGDVGAKHLALALSVKRQRKDQSRARLPVFPSLVYGGNQLTPKGLLYFASCIVQNKSICGLFLDGNVQLGDQAGVVLSDLLHCFTSLTDISVQNTGLTKEGASTLLSACEGSDTIRSVQLGSNEKWNDLQQVSMLATKFKIENVKLEQMVRETAADT